MRRRRRTASFCDRKLGRLGRLMAHYVLIWTSVDVTEMSTREVLRTYRLRWQIELVFKRMKSIMGLGLLPKRTDGSSRAWLNGKLFVALLVEKLWRQAEHFSPWGYNDPCAAQPLA
ncbi:MAG: transposase [Phycisphaerae bacterium]